MLENPNVDLLVRQLLFQFRLDERLRKFRAVNRNVDLIQKVISLPVYEVLVLVVSFFALESACFPLFLTLSPEHCNCRLHAFE